MSLTEFFEFTRAGKPGSLVIQGVLWLLGVLLVAAAVDRNKNERGIRVDVGWFFLFLFTAGILSYFIFGFIPTF